MRKVLSLTVLGGALVLGLWAADGRAGDGAKDQGKIRVVLIDGQNNHDWRATTPVMKAALEKGGRFLVDVSTAPLAKSDKRGLPKGWKAIPFPPDLTKYDVVLSNYNGASWPQEFNQALDGRLKEGKIGLVIVHAANNAFGGWKEYNQMIGMGWRGKDAGERLKVDASGREMRVPKGGDLGSGHRYTGPFQVMVRDPNHPITKGMPHEWLHARDELYDNMRGPIQNVHLLATAYSKGTQTHEPMIWTVSYGKGRVFHTPMGHDVTAMRCIGFITTLERGIEWAATGGVTIPIPANFPKARETSSVPAK